MTNDPGVRRRRNPALPGGVGTLARALIRISASPDLDAVLQEVVDSARAFTGAWCGMITTVGERGRPDGFFSSGLTPDEHRLLAEWDDGPRVFEHLLDRPQPLRVADVPGYVRSLGFSAPVLPGNTLRGTPVRDRDVHLGDLFVTGKEDGREFADDAEEMLMLFASQAAKAIANARAQRDEHRARRKLEVMADTSPAGVVVFDAGTGDAESVNAAAQRIVGGLGLPDRPVEQLLGLVTCLRADGSEVALKDFPVERLPGRGETVGAEEIVLSVPGGRSVRTLVNAAPVHAPEGGVESVVVTMQDMAPFEELERMRAGLLAVTSHGWRAPLTSVNGSGGAMLDAPSVPGVRQDGTGNSRARKRILVVDDDPQARLDIRDTLAVAGYHVLATGDTRELPRVIRAEKPHLVLLELMLPGTDGIELMEKVSGLAGRPVIFISAYGRDETIARALGLGAADYIVKPFSSAELTARVRAVLRRHADGEPFVLRELSIDYERRRVTLAGRPVELTATEYGVLRVLSANAGRAVTYHSLLRQAWSRYPDRPSPAIVRAVVKRLRRKLGEDAASASYVLTERQVGYRTPATGER